MQVALRLHLVEGQQPGGEVEGQREKGEAEGQQEEGAGALVLPLDHDDAQAEVGEEGEEEGEEEEEEEGEDYNDDDDVEEGDGGEAEEVEEGDDEDGLQDEAMQRQVWVGIACLHYKWSNGEGD